VRFASAADLCHASFVHRLYFENGTNISCCVYREWLIPIQPTGDCFYTIVFDSLDLHTFNFEPNICDFSKPVTCQSVFCELYK